MGGLGSGRWYRFGRRKTTTEESLSLGIADFRDRLDPDSAGSTLYWSRRSVSYLVTWDAGGPTVTLRYRCRGQIDVRLPIRLQATYPALGGRRWWFTCPLTVGGLACNRRVGKLYLPPGARHFGCRRCHDLTYRSSQEAHRTERLSAWFDREWARFVATGRVGPQTS